VDLEARDKGACILLRIRHPEDKPMTGVTVNGKTWRDFDATKEWVKIPGASGKYEVEVSY
jgi:hypothetical protein